MTERDDRVARLWDVLKRCEYAAGWNAWQQLTAVLRLLREVDAIEPPAAPPAKKRRAKGARR